MPPAGDRKPGSTQSPMRQRMVAVCRLYRDVPVGKPLSSGAPAYAELEKLRNLIVNSEMLQTRPAIDVTFSAGRGNWAEVPWVALMDRRETSSTQRGLYCVYLFRADLTGVYLCLAQGTENLRREKGTETATHTLRERAAGLTATVEPLVALGFQTGLSVQLRGTGTRSLSYEQSAIASKLYLAGDIPGDHELLRDLGAVLDAYNICLAQRIETEGALGVGQAAFAESGGVRKQDGPEVASVPNSISGRQVGLQMANATGARLDETFETLSAGIEQLRRRVSERAKAASDASDPEALEHAARLMREAREIGTQAETLRTRVKAWVDEVEEAANAAGNTAIDEAPHWTLDSEEAADRPIVQAAGQGGPARPSHRSRATSLPRDDLSMFEDMEEHERREVARKLLAFEDKLAIQPSADQPYFLLHVDGQPVDNAAGFIEGELGVRTRQSAPRVLSGLVEYLIGARDDAKWEGLSTKLGTASYSGDLAAKWAQLREAPQWARPVPLSELVQDDRR